MEVSASRKRKLSTETAFLPQLKCYVNENLQNQRNEKKMQEIYSKFHFSKFPENFNNLPPYQAGL